MVKIRLKRVGKKKQPSYRVVVADSRSPRDGRIIESIGHYQPRLEPSEIAIDSDRAVYWLRQGAQPSDGVRKLLQISGAWAEFTGEAPPAPAAPPSPQEARRKATAAASVDETSASPPPSQEGATDKESAAPGSEPEEK